MFSMSKQKSNPATLTVSGNTYMLGTRMFGVATAKDA